MERFGEPTFARFSGETNTSSWSYDALGRITEYVDPGQSAFAFRYDGRADLVRIEYQGQPVQEFQYDEQGRGHESDRPEPTGRVDLSRLHILRVRRSGGACARRRRSSSGLGLANREPNLTPAPGQASVKGWLCVGPVPRGPRRPRRRAPPCLLSGMPEPARKRQVRKSALGGRETGTEAANTVGCRRTWIRVDRGPGVRRARTAPRLAHGGSVRLGGSPDHGVLRPARAHGFDCDPCQRPGDRLRRGYAYDAGGVCPTCSKPSKSRRPRWTERRPLTWHPWRLGWAPCGGTTPATAPSAARTDFCPGAPAGPVEHAAAPCRRIPGPRRRSRRHPARHHRPRRLCSNLGARFSPPRVRPARPPRGGPLRAGRDHRTVPLRRGR